MTLAVSTQVNPVASRLAADTAMGATAQNNVFGAPVTLHLVEIDNTANAGAPSYVKLYNAVSCVPGTTDPTVVLMAPAATKLTYAVPGGVIFATGLSCCCVTSPGTPGTTAPTSSVPVRMLASV
jgi:hypothetical protein